MRRQDQIAEARKLLSHIDNRTTALADSVYRNPVTDYTCPRQAARERELFFEDGPINIGLSALLPRAGDWMTHDYAGVPILLARRADRLARRRFSMSAGIAARASRRDAAATPAASRAPITAGPTISTAP